MQRGRLRRLLVVMALAAAILAAVAVLAPGSSPELEPGVSTTSTAPTGSAAVALPDPCELVTGPDAESAVGQALEQSSPGESTCVYASEGGGDAPAVTLRIDVRHAPAGVDDLLSQRDDAIRALGVATVSDVADLGDAAFVSNSEAATLLHVVSGQVALVIGVAGTVTDRVAIARDLAAAALGRI